MHHRLAVIVAISAVFGMACAPSTIRDWKWDGTCTEYDGTEHTVTLGPLSKPSNQQFEFVDADGNMRDKSGDWGRYGNPSGGGETAIDGEFWPSLEWEHCHAADYCEVGPLTLPPASAQIRVSDPAVGRTLTAYLEPDEGYNDLTGACYLVRPDGSWFVGQMDIEGKLQ